MRYASFSIEPQHSPQERYVHSDQIDSWAQAIVAQYPDLEPHIVELVDHVESMVDAATAAGISESAALRNAIESLGDPKLLTAQFLTTGCAECTVFGRRVTVVRALVLFNVAYVSMSLAWAVFVLATNELNWMLAGWTATSLLLWFAAPKQILQPQQNQMFCALRSLRRR